MRKRMKHGSVNIIAKDNGASIASIIALVLVGVGVFATYIFASSTAAQQDQQDQQRQEQLINGFNENIDTTIRSFSQILLGAEGMISVKGVDNITGKDWAVFHDSINLNTTYPAIQAVGFAPYANPDQIQNVMQSFKSEPGLEGTVLNPDTRQSEYAVIKYIEPSTQENKAIVGYNMFSESKRKDALTRARDNAQPAMTEPLVIRQDIDSAKSKTNGFIMYYPVYQTPYTPPDIEQRRGMIKGYVYIAFRVDDILSSQKNVIENNNIQLKISDREAGDINEIYNSQANSQAFETQLSTTKSIDILDRNWNVTLYTENNNSKEIRTFILFVAGIICSILVGIAAFFILTSRFHRISQKHLNELQRTKEELVALASHQLRTPASGVRQYLLMLDEGYFGKVSTEQKQAIHRAFASNERQLEIIDQLLYVAKADAGQLLLAYEKLDLVSMIDEIIDDYHDQAEAKSITIKFNRPKNMVIVADTRYIRMAIENLVSNAIKYSYSNSAVNIKLSKKKNNVEISVNDEGVGIKKDDLHRLFEKFSRVDNPLSQREGGTGLGLYLALKIVQSHGGSITFNTKEKSGSTFIINLPIKDRWRRKSVIQITD